MRNKVIDIHKSGKGYNAQGYKVINFATTSTFVFSQPKMYDIIHLILVDKTLLRRFNTGHHFFFDLQLFNPDILYFYCFMFCCSL